MSSLPRRGGGGTPGRVDTGPGLQAPRPAGLGAACPGARARDPSRIRGAGDRAASRAPCPTPKAGEPDPPEVRGRAREGPQAPGSACASCWRAARGPGRGTGSSARARLPSFALSSVSGSHRAEPRPSVPGPKGGVQRSVPHCSPPRPSPGLHRAGREGLPGHFPSGSHSGPCRTWAHGPLLPPCGSCGESWSPRAGGGCCVGSGSAPNSRPHGWPAECPCYPPPHLPAHSQEPTSNPHLLTSPTSRACLAANQGPRPLRVHRRSPAQARSGSWTPHPARAGLVARGGASPRELRRGTQGRWPVAWRPRALGLGGPGPRLKAGGPHPQGTGRLGTAPQAPAPPTLPVPGGLSPASESSPGKLRL